MEKITQDILGNTIKKLKNDIIKSLFIDFSF